MAASRGAGWAWSARAGAAVQVDAQGGPGGVTIGYGPGSYFKFADQKIEGRKLTMEVRAFDDGVAFRYIVPEQSGIKSANIEHELTRKGIQKFVADYRSTLRKVC